MENKTTINQEALLKAQELILYMDNDEPTYNRKQAWVNNYKRKIKKGIFNIEDGIKGMSYLMKDALDEYNKDIGTDKEGKIPDVYITILKNEKRTIQIEFLDSVLSECSDYEEIRDKATELRKLLKRFFS